MKQLYFTVTNDLTYDQRMHRICTSLAEAGYGITLVGREVKTSLPLQQRPFAQKRLRCFFNRSFLFYAEYNLRLFVFLLPKRMEAICAIDLDTILPVYFVSKWKGVRRVYDAHEYFTELKEVRTRPLVRWFWTGIERFAVPKFDNGYTVSEGLAIEFQQKYKRNYQVIRNLPVLRPQQTSSPRQPVLIYQGAVNEARGFEYLIPAMKKISYRLLVCGDGNYMSQLQKLIDENGVGDKVELKGMLLPEDLRKVAVQAALGIGLAEKEGINQFYALPNKFLEYMHAGLPQIAMNFPEYQKINQQYKVAVLLDDLSVDGVAEAINKTMANRLLLAQLHENAVKARNLYCWQNEEKVLLHFYRQLFS